MQRRQEGQSRLASTFSSELYDMLASKEKRKTKMLYHASDLTQLLPPGYDLAKGLIKSSKIVIKEYDMTREAPRPSAELPAEKKAENNECWRLTSVLDNRRKAVKHWVIDCLYENSDSGKATCEGAMFQDRETDVWNEFAGSRDGMEGCSDPFTVKDDNWAKAAEHAERAIRRVLKYLPEET